MITAVSEQRNVSASMAVHGWTLLQRIQWGWIPTSAVLRCHAVTTGGALCRLKAETTNWSSDSINCADAKSGIDACNVSEAIRKTRGGGTACRCHQWSWPESESGPDHDCDMERSKRRAYCAVVTLSLSLFADPSVILWSLAMAHGGSLLLRDADGFSWLLSRCSRQHTRPEAGLGQRGVMAHRDR